MPQHRVLTDDERTWIQWVTASCELFGASSSTAMKVGAIFADGFERGTLRAAGGVSDA